MSDYYQLKNQNIFNPPPNTDMGNVNSQFDTMYVQNALVLGNVSVTGTTIIAPRISDIAYPGDDTAADTAGGQTIILNGSGFVAGANVLINGSAVGVVSVVSSTVITFTSPANATGSYVIYVINPDGSTAIAIPGIQYSGTPNWTTAAGTLGNVYETASFNQTVTATGDAPITYSVFSGSLPPGSTFNANGTITGTSQLTASPTTYSFTVRATDAEQQDTNRAFSISVIPDVVTWSTPTDNATYSPAANIAMANITLSATSAVGSGITYSANTLPTGLSLTGANISGTPTVQANTSSLLTATANTTSESSSITINWVVSVASDPYFMYNSLLLPGTGTNGAQNNTFLDGSTNNFTITRAGNTTQGTFSPYGPNWSNYFDRTGDYLTAPSSANFTFPGNFTIECWIYVPSVSQTIQRIFSSNAGPTGACFFSVGNDTGAGGGAGKLCANGQLTPPYYDGLITAPTAIPTNTWIHAALVRSGSTVTIYQNGVSVASGTNSATWDFNNSAGIRISGTPWSGTEDFGGYISNLRVVKGTAVYTSNFTPSTTPLTAISGTSLLTCQSNRFIDNSTNNFTITKNGDTNVQRFSPFSPTQAYSTSTIGGSGYFDGTGDYLYSTGSGTTYDLTGDFCVEGWFYFTSLTDLGVWGIQPANGQAGLRLTTESNLTVVLISGNGTSHAGPFSSSVAPGTYRWNHIAVTRSGSAITLWLNGISVGTGSSASWTGTNLPINLGLSLNYANGSPYYMNGYISNFRVVKGSAVYTSTFTPPTAPVTAITNTQLLLNYTNAGIIDNTMLNNLETVGNAQISSAQTKFGSGSMYFDGSGDYLTQPSSQNFNFGTGNFTMEGWFYQTGLSSSYPAIISNPLAYSSAGAWGLLSSHASSGVRKLQFYCYNADVSNPLLLGTTTMSDNTWYYFALTRSGTTFRLFLNGTIEATATFGGSVTSVSSGLVVGINQTAYPFQGYIDDLRITNGYARYTSNFTPPTSAFPTY